MIPALVQWEFTDKCSYRCQHCYHKNPSDHSNISLGLSKEAMWQMSIFPDPKPPYERTGAGDAFSSTFASVLCMDLSCDH